MEGGGGLAEEASKGVKREQFFVNVPPRYHEGPLEGADHNAGSGS